MPKWLWIAGFLLAMTPAAWGDMAAGNAAAKRGDYAAAYREFYAAANTGDHEAENNLGLFYLRGLGVAKDPAAAVSWFEKAASSGLIAGELNLGGCYAYGTGVPRNAVKALEWFQKAASQGSLDGEFDVAWMYHSSGMNRNFEGISPDNARAAKLFTDAAERGFAKAQNELGNMYLNGEGGLPRDWVQAYKWYSLAARAGIEMSRVSANGLVEGLPGDGQWRLTPAQKAEGDRLVEEWKPKTGAPLLAASP
jgi:TPR repeat protein